MNVDIRLDTHGPLSFKNGFPSEFSGHLLPQAFGQHAKGPWGIICIQELRTEKYLFRHFLFSLQKSISFQTHGQSEGLQSLLSLAGTFEHTIQGLKTALLREKEYILFNAGREVTSTMVHGGRLNSLLNAYYTPNSYRSFLPFFPSFRKDLKKAARKPYYFIYPPKVARYTVHDAINAIWLDKYIQSLQVKHAEIRMESSLFTLLAQSYAPNAVVPVTSFESEKAEAARAIILKDIKKHLPPELIASELHCSTGWLKKAFRKVYGVGLFQFLRKNRMEHAKEMLLGGESLKAVALEVGMKPRNFPKEFKAFYGYTVTALKKGQA